MLKILFLCLSALSNADESGGADASKGTTETYIELKPFIIPVVKGDQIYAYVRVLVNVMTKDATSIFPFKPYEPLLRDRYFADVYGALCDQWLPGQEPNRDTVAKRLQRVTDHLVGPDKLRVLITHFYFYRPEDKK